MNYGFSPRNSPILPDLHIQPSTLTQNKSEPGYLKNTERPNLLKLEICKGPYYVGLLCYIQPSSNYVD